MSTIGFIGFGNMAKAIAKGIMDKKAVEKKDIYFSDPFAEDTLGVNKAKNNAELAQKCDYIVLAVKPNMIDQVCAEIAAAAAGKPVASIAAGITSAHLTQKLAGSRILRIMPNTGAQIGMSYTCFNAENTLKKEEMEFFLGVFQAVGKVNLIGEKYFNAAAAVCSCGVAFGHMLAESMADGGVLVGLPKDQGVEMASWAILAACEMILLSGASPTELKDQICSPGGMTAAAMRELEDGCFRGTVIDAIEAATQRGNELS